MEKEAAYSCALCILLVLCTSCGSSKNAAIQVADNSFTMTPQAYIDYLNRAAENYMDDGLVQIPNYTESGQKIEIDTGFDLTLTTDDDGNLTGIEWSWFSSRSNDMNSSFYLGVALGMVIPDQDEIEQTAQELKLLEYTQSDFECYSSYGDVAFAHSMYTSITNDNVQFHFVDILPLKD